MFPTKYRPFRFVRGRRGADNKDSGFVIADTDNLLGKEEFKWTAS